MKEQGDYTVYILVFSMLFMPDIPHNWTPTFRLTSIEKPDISPYLFHMTTRESLKNILEDEKTGQQEGRLIAQIPRHCEGYNIKMVCFTETPPFALDFFRYRWSDNKNRVNLKYGIGFDKEAMVRKGVFPTFYVSNELQSKIFNLLKKLDNSDLADSLLFLNCNNNQIIENLTKIFKDTSQTLKSVKRLMFPLLENHRYQGYIWEREWRYTSPNPNNEDFIFSYDDIRIICCADEDENIFKGIIGEVFVQENPIQFIRTWEQYDEIKDFLNRRNQDIVNSNINYEIQKNLAQWKILDRYILQFENSQKSIDEIKQLRDALDKNIQKIALIKVFEEISQCTVDQKLKKLIIESDCEIVINAIAAYRQNRNHHLSINQENPENDSPPGFLSKAIEKKWLPRGQNPEQEIADIRKHMNKIIEKDLEIDIEKSI